MVCTRQEARADSSPVRDERLVETGDRGLERDPLVDTASFVPAGRCQPGRCNPDKESHQDSEMSGGYLMEMGRGLSPHQQ